ncbi:hypothetical protein IFM89_024848 [Coptis chinensis]|uniref:Uncharacterized protein n=1 Tax=Coptis chinensis TaxID=261450 RepID=A0A835LWK5_9MAGN|nr:hypothetical protein IFM89_024848 [Coptis chinensis]
MIISFKIFTYGEGMAFRSGSVVVAHEAINAIMGPHTIQTETMTMAIGTIAPTMGGASGLTFAACTTGHSMIILAPMGVTPASANST